MNYCHTCKLFCSNKAKFTEHRFSITHKRTMAENEKPFEEKKEMKVRKDRKRKAIEEDTSVVTFENLEHEFTNKNKGKTSKKKKTEKSDIVQKGRVGWTPKPYF